MPVVPITSLDDERLDPYLRLTEHQLRSRIDPSRATIIAESRLVIETALERGLEPLSLLVDERHLPSLATLLADLPSDVPVFAASRDLMSSITGFTVTRGYLCAMRRPATKTVEQVLENARHVAVLEGIVDVTNAGAIFRSAAALGLDAVLLSPTCTDPLSRRSLRVSMGSVLKVPWARFDETWPTGAIELLHAHGFSCAALALRPDAIPLDKAAFERYDKLAFFLGTEGAGLTAPVIDACDMSIIIPMANEVDSLNVGAAAAIAFWELQRTTRSGT